jgi:hypothetical protein
MSGTILLIANLERRHPMDKTIIERAEALGWEAHVLVNAKDYGLTVPIYAVKLTTGWEMFTEEDLNFLIGSIEREEAHAPINPEAEAER